MSSQYVVNPQSGLQVKVGGSAYQRLVKSGVIQPSSVTTRSSRSPSPTRRASPTRSPSPRGFSPSSTRSGSPDRLRFEARSGSPTRTGSPGRLSPNQIQLAKRNTGRQVLITYHMNQDGTNVEFGVSNDVAYHTHFEVIGPALPEGTKVLVLSPNEQRYVLPDGVIIKGIAYRTLEDLKEDIRNKAANLHEFIQSHMDHSGMGKKQHDLMESYLALARGEVVELFRENWALHEVTLP